MAQIALPEMRRYNYDDRLATGAVAAGGTIGILIPPSIIMVIYGLSDRDQHLAAVSRRVPAGSSDGRRVHAGDRGDDPHRSAPRSAGAARVGARTGCRALRSVWGPAVLFLLVIGGLYIGVFSPTEAASIGAVGALLLGVLNRGSRPPGDSPARCWKP